MSERLELPSSLSKGDAWDNVKPCAGALTQCPLWWQCTNCSSIMVLEGGKSFLSVCCISIVYVLLFCTPEDVQPWCSSQPVWPQSEWLMEMVKGFTKGNGKICEGTNSSRAFQAKMAKHEGRLCNTSQRLFHDWGNAWCRSHINEWHPKPHHWWEF